ncbi:MAG TPA: 3-deoxy-manno-octulosonate cytidylyltransferase, partial [Candidatus Cloacimonas sp.]|nr:3-deoxy-manno-octulosonate cytidylyltransferase [Candidatus Cloacimonas sp.]
MIIAVIPARYDSTRLPGKPLKILGDKPIIQHVYEKAEAARVFDRVIVATDDVRIYKKVKSFGGKVQMTSASHQSGSDRIAEVVRGIPAVEIVVNVQGDEPFITSSALQHLVKLFEDDEVQVASLMHRMKKGFDNPNRVKVVCDEHNFALYFSRLPVPYHGKNEKL